MTRHTTLVVVVATLTVLAGCGSLGTSSTTPATDSATPSPTTTVEAERTPAATATPTATPTETPTATPDPATQNPWDQETITIGMRVGANVEDESAIRRIVRDAVQWADQETFAYPVDLELAGEETPDVVINVQPLIESCGGEQPDSLSYRWCGPKLDPGSRAAGIETVDIAGAYSNATVRAATRGGLARLFGDDTASDRAGVSLPERSTFRDPWVRQDTVVVGVATPGNESRAFAPLVNESLAYWQSGPGARFANYSTTFVVRPNAANPDVRVRLVSSIVECGTELDSFTVGCADLLSKQDVADGDEQIRIEAGYTNASTRRVLRHEWGHLLGRYHGQQPRGVMNATIETTRLPTPNASERRNA